MLICGDPALAIADRELNGRVVALIGKMKDDEAKAAFAEYARWTRERDRKCDLADKDNVPLPELSSSEACLADYISRKTAEIVAAKGDPKRGVRPTPTLSPPPDADAVDLCVAQIHSANACGDFLRVSRIIQIDTEVSAEQALVTAEVEMKVLSPFAVVQPDRLELHRNVLGPAIRTGESRAGKPRKPAGRAPAQNRKVVRVSEVRRRRLALQRRRAAADRTRSRDARPMTRWDIGYKVVLRIPFCDRFSKRHAMLQCSPNGRYIPFGENMTIQIFSFSFRNLPLIDAILLTGIPSRQIR